MGQYLFWIKQIGSHDRADLRAEKSRFPIHLKPGLMKLRRGVCPDPLRKKGKTGGGQASAPFRAIQAQDACPRKNRSARGGGIRHKRFESKDPPRGLTFSKFDHASQARLQLSLVDRSSTLCNFILLSLPRFVSGVSRPTL